MTWDDDETSPIRPRPLLANPTFTSWRSLILRLEVLPCPRSTRFATIEYRTSQLIDDGDQASAWFLVREVVGHWRRHAAGSLVALAIIGAGTFTFAFTYDNLLEAATWALVGTMIAVGAWFLAPRVGLVEGGCPTFARRSADPHARRRLPLVMTILGLLLMGSVSTMSVQSPIFDPSTIAGTFIGGLGIFGIGLAAHLENLVWLRRALTCNAIGALAIAFGDIGWACQWAPTRTAAAASLTTATGCLLYAVSVRNLQRCFTGDPGPSGTSCAGRERRVA